MNETQKHTFRKSGLRMEVTIENRVYTSTIDDSPLQSSKLSMWGFLISRLGEMRSDVFDFEIKHKHYEHVVIRYKEGGSQMIFENGNVIETGFKSENTANIKLDYLESVIITPLKITNRKIQNIVATAKCNVHVRDLHRLESTFNRHSHIKNVNTSYNPNEFSGLVVKFSHRRTALIFEKGVFILAGYKDTLSLINNARYIFFMIKRNCLRYRRYVARERGCSRSRTLKTRHARK